VLNSSQQACWLPTSTLDRDAELNGFSTPLLVLSESLLSVSLAKGFLRGGVQMDYFLRAKLACAVTCWLPLSPMDRDAGLSGFNSGWASLEVEPPSICLGKGFLRGEVFRFSLFSHKMSWGLENYLL
jgi:hypothetical protein